MRSINDAANCSNFARLSERTKCFGPDAVAVIYGRLISVAVVEDNSILAFSAASFKRCRAMLSFRRSMDSSALNSSASQSMIT